jgi:hypothetical protein
MSLPNTCIKLYQLIRCNQQFIGSSFVIMFISIFFLILSLLVLIWQHADHNFLLFLYRVIGIKLTIIRKILTYWLLNSLVSSRKAIFFYVVVG